MDFLKREKVSCAIVVAVGISLELPLIASVIASTGLYWIDSGLSWKELLNFWSYNVSVI